MRLLLAAIAASALLVGCAAPQPLLVKTDSGQPEAKFAGRTLEQVRDRLVNACMSDGMQARTAPNEVVCEKQMTGGSGVAAQLLIGNSYSTPPVQAVRFNFAAVGDVVRVVAYPYVETQMAFGQVRRVPVDGPRVANDIQRMLLTIGGY